MKISKDQAVRMLIREYVQRKLKEGEAGTPKEEPEVEPETEEEPAVEEPEEEEEIGLTDDQIDLTDMFVRKLKDPSMSTDQEDIVGIIVRVFDAFNYGNQAKLNILKAIKEESIR